MTYSRPAVLQIQGMTCDDCAIHVNSALRKAGAKNVTVNWKDARTQFNWPENIPESALREAISNAGYRSGALEIRPESKPGQIGGSKDYNLVIIGSGSAAFAAAIKAADAGYSVAIIEEGVVGGTCVNVGCVPSKALLRAGELQWQANNHSFEGIQLTSSPADLAQLVLHKDELVTDLRKHKYLDLITEYGFTLIVGKTRFTSPETIEVDGKQITADRFLIATGALATVPPIEGLAEAGYLTSATALTLDSTPKRVVVIGANAIGLELGQFFLHIGSKVTFVDTANRIAPFEEPEISQKLTEVLTEQGAAIHVNAIVTKITVKGPERVVHILSNGQRSDITADEIVIAIGRRPNTDAIGLGAADVQVDHRGAVIVDDQLRTANPAIFAAGDVTGGPQFVYVAAYEGALAVDNALLGLSRTLNFEGLPRVTFTLPQIASAGMTEVQARSAGYDVMTSILPLNAVPRALVNRDTGGLVN